MRRFLLAIAMTVGCCAVLIADEAKEALRAKRLEQMKTLASETHVIRRGAKEEAQLVASPVFRYDDQPRRFLDATVWVWTEKGRPVAIEKVEAVLELNTNKPQWGYCFTSLAEDQIAAHWNQRKDGDFRATEAGLTFKPLLGVDPTAAREAERKRQMRNIMRDFTARIIINPRENVTAEMRLLTTPLYEYSDPESKQLIGGVFGFSTNGTNPDMVVVLESRDGKWQFAPARMTSGGLVLKHHDDTFWTVDLVDFRKGPFPNWHCFHTDRTPVEGE
jgi:hypothetical protein